MLSKESGFFFDLSRDWILASEWLIKRDIRFFGYNVGTTKIQLIMDLRLWLAPCLRSSGCMFLHISTRPKLSVNSSIFCNHFSRAVCNPAFFYLVLRLIQNRLKIKLVILWAKTFWVIVITLKESKFCRLFLYQL